MLNVFFYHTSVSVMDQKQSFNGVEVIYVVLMQKLCHYFTQLYIEPYYIQRKKTVNSFCYRIVCLFLSFFCCCLASINGLMHLKILLNVFPIKSYAFILLHIYKSERERKTVLTVEKFYHYI